LCYLSISDNTTDKITGNTTNNITHPFPQVSRILFPWSKTVKEDLAQKLSSTVANPSLISDNTTNNITHTFLDFVPSAHAQKH